MDTSKIKILVFDTFGTVVDWHGTIVGEGQELGKKYGVDVDWSAFATEWRTEYFVETRAIAKGEKPYQNIDIVFHDILLRLLPKYKLEGIIPDEEIESFSKVWHRLNGWEDTVEGLKRLKVNHMIGPFTNGDFRLVLDMAKTANLDWDFIITADIFHKFKPDPSIYVDCVKFLGAEPEEIMMVAAHPFDLDGAKACGCSTAYIVRGEEYGKDSGYVEPAGEYEPDITLPDFNALADYLKANP